MPELEKVKCSTPDFAEETAKKILAFLPECAGEGGAVDIEKLKQCLSSIEFAKETLALLPFLFVTYLVLEAVEAHAGGALERGLERTRAVGPLVGALAGAIPQCGVSAAAASLYAGGVVSVGTLLAVFLSTSDELVPVLISKQVPVALMVKIVALKAAAGIISGFSVDAVLRFARHVRRPVEVHDLCAHSLCGCSRRKGILVPALIHTAEIFLFIVVVSGQGLVPRHELGAEPSASPRPDAHSRARADGEEEVPRRGVRRARLPQRMQSAGCDAH